MKKSLVLKSLAAIGAILAGLIPWLFNELALPWRMVITMAVVVIALSGTILALVSRREQVGSSGIGADLTAIKSEENAREIPAVPRLARELSQGDPLLDQADQAVFVGLTFRSLSSGLASGVTSPKALEDVTLYVFSLPVLRLLHPTLRGRASLAQEWRTHVAGALTGLLGAAPNLRRLDLLLLDADPNFTLSRLHLPGTGSAPPRHYLRWTPLVEGVMPRDMPTLIFESVGKDTREIDPVFEAFDDLAMDLVRRRAVRRFPVLRRDQNYLREGIEDFVESLSAVSTHPIVRLKDASFAAVLRGPEHVLPTSPRVQPWEVRLLYERFITGDGVTSFSAVPDLTSRIVTITVDDGTGAPVGHRDVVGPHFVAAFALLVLGPPGAPRVLMVDKPKPGWKLDVPGGKLAEDDAGWSDALHRELVEELSFHIDSRDEFTPTAWVYDAKSRKEGEAVVAGYAIHRLSSTDARYAESFVVGGTESSGSKITTVTTASLLKAKRAARSIGKLEEVECHAPLHAIEQI